MEGLQRELQVTTSIIPLARTPADKKSAHGMKKYTKDVAKMIEGIAPWVKRQHYKRRRAMLKHNVKPGEIVVILDGGESSNIPLFKDAKISRKK